MSNGMLTDNKNTKPLDYPDTDNKQNPNIKDKEAKCKRRGVQERYPAPGPILKTTGESRDIKERC